MTEPATAAAATTSATSAPYAAPAPLAATATLPALAVPVVVMLRRAAFALLYLGTIAGMSAWLWHLLAPGGIAWIEALILVAFVLTMPWLALGFWNGALGFLIKALARSPNAVAVPELARSDPAAPVSARTAILYPIRNEDPARAMARLGAILASVDATGQGAAFDAFVLSDTSDPAIASAEETAFAALRAGHARPERLHYRRREQNTGFKAGNILDWCDRFGAGYELMVTLDADSMMTGAKLVEVVRIMQASPRLGILQTLCTGLPAIAAFPRLFQFGMRHGMRSYSMGQSWWQDDAGPYWGHNAVIRVAPFAAHARLPVLPGKPPFGGPILSHDQVEAVMMRKAGFAVRALPDDVGSYEENPPTLLEFLRRDLRWGQGNFQYLRLMALPGLPPMGRVQFLHAILLYLVGPLWVLLAALAALYPFTAAAAAQPFAGVSAALLFLFYLAFSVAPKLFGFLHTLVDARERAAFGGTRRILAGVAAETLYSAVLFPVMSLSQGRFLFLLAAGRSVGWGSQARDPRRVTWAEAWAMLRFPTLFGWTGLSAFAVAAPLALPFAALVLLGPALSVPFAVATADPRLGRWLARRHVAAMPEELAPPPEIAALDLPAVAAARAL